MGKLPLKDNDPFAYAGAIVYIPHDALLYFINQDGAVKRLDKDKKLKQSTDEDINLIKSLFIKSFSADADEDTFNHFIAKFSSPTMIKLKTKFNGGKIINSFITDYLNFELDDIKKKINNVFSNKDFKSLNELYEALMEYKSNKELHPSDAIVVVNTFTGQDFYQGILFTKDRYDYDKSKTTLIVDDNDKNLVYTMDFKDINTVERGEINFKSPTDETFDKNLIVSRLKRGNTILESLRIADAFNTYINFMTRHMGGKKIHLLMNLNEYVLKGIIDSLFNAKVDEEMSANDVVKLMMNLLNNRAVSKSLITKVDDEKRMLQNMLGDDIMESIASLSDFVSNYITWFSSDEGKNVFTNKVFEHMINRILDKCDD